MKICKVIFQNVNALAGQWCIDFESEAFRKTQIFAITGPTGVGKTTILDAICLALYERTPRIEKAGASLASEVMTKGTGECFAEVVFENHGKRYRARWEAWRSGRKPGGAMQIPKPYFEDLQTHQAEDKVEPVKAAVVQATGLDFSQFTRAMMLVQGDFSAFLKASPRERLDLLEKVMGLQDLRAVAEEIYRRQSELGHRVEAQGAALQGITLLSDEEKATLQAKRAALTVEAVSLQTKRDEAHAIVMWLQDVVKAASAMTEAQQAKVQAEEAKAAFVQSEERLLKAQAAAKVEGWEALCQTKAQAAQKKRDAEQAEQEQAQAETSAGEAKIELEQAQAQAERVKAERLQSEALFEQVAALDVKIEAAQRRCDDAKSAAEEARRQMQAQNDAFIKHRQVFEASEDRAKNAKAFLEAHAGDRALCERLSGIQGTAEAFKQANNAEQEAQKAKYQAEKAAAEASQEKRIREQAEAEAQHRLLQATEIDAESQQAMAALLEGESYASLFQKRDQMRERFRTLKDAKQIVCELKTSEAQGAQMQAQASEMANAKATLEEAVKQACQAESMASEAVEVGLQRQAEAKGWVAQATKVYEEQSALRQLILNAEEMRKQLKPGTPCPCCGALEHPFAEGQRPQEDTSKTMLDNARAKLDEADAALLNLQKQRDAALRAKEEKLRERDYQASRIEGLQQQINLWAEAYKGLQTKANAALLVIEESLDAETESRIAQKLTACEEQGKLLSQRITQIEALEKTIETSSRALKAAQEQMNEASKAAQAAVMTAQHLTQKAEETASRLQTETAKKASARDALWTEVAPFSVREAALSDLDGLILKLEERKAAYVHAEEEAKTSALDCMSAQAEMKAAAEKLEPLKAAAEQMQSASEKVAVEKQALDIERQNLFGTKSIAEEKAKAAEISKRAGELLEKSLSKLMHMQELKAGLAQKQMQIASDLERLAIAEGAQKRHFEASLRQFGFESEALWAEARIEQNELQRLETAKAQIEHAVVSAQAAFVQSEKAYLQKRAEHDQAIDEDEAQSNLETADALLNACKEERLDLESKLASDARDAERFKTQKAEFDKLLQTFNEWKGLQQLMGTKDGNQYRAFVLSMAMDAILASANQHLDNLSDHRYQLCREENADMTQEKSAAQPADIENALPKSDDTDAKKKPKRAKKSDADGDASAQKDLDRYFELKLDDLQCAAKRSVQNLSGGESFLVSLSLALGLSSLSSRDVPIESLFIDEGFGTLDEQTLNLVLNVLGSLQGSGKLIGIISHVEELKNIIDLQVEIVRTPKQGWSKFKNPEYVYKRA